MRKLLRFLLRLIFKNRNLKRKKRGQLAGLAGPRPGRRRSARAPARPSFFRGRPKARGQAGLPGCRTTFFLCFFFSGLAQLLRCFFLSAAFAASFPLDRSLARFCAGQAGCRPAPGRVAWPALFPLQRPLFVAPYKRGLLPQRFLSSFSLSPPLL